VSTRSAVKPSELYTAARIADALVYAAGIAGVVAGGLLFQEGYPGFTLVAWALTFCVGAGLRLIAWSAKGVAQLLERTDALVDEVGHLQRRLAQSGPPSAPQQVDPDRDPYRRWGGFH